MNDELSAFPLKDYSEGMTLRDYFAAKAMQAFASRSDYIACPDECIAIDAYSLADQMMKQRENK